MYLYIDVIAVVFVAREMCLFGENGRTVLELARNIVRDFCSRSKVGSMEYAVFESEVIFNNFVSVMLSCMAACYKLDKLHLYHERQCLLRDNGRWGRHEVLAHKQEP